MNKPTRSIQEPCRQQSVSFVVFDSAQLDPSINQAIIDFYSAPPGSIDQRNAIVALLKIMPVERRDSNDKYGYKAQRRLMRTAIDVTLACCAYPEFQGDFQLNQYLFRAALDKLRACLDKNLGHLVYREREAFFETLGRQRQIEGNASLANLCKAYVAGHIATQQEVSAGEDQRRNLQETARKRRLPSSQLQIPVPPPTATPGIPKPYRDSWWNYIKQRMPQA